jgi:hypothetical protein
MSDEKTLSVPEAGRRYFGLSRGGSYLAARRGDFPLVKVGRLLRVPVRAMERRLDRVDEQSTA